MNKVRYIMAGVLLFAGGIVVSLSVGFMTGMDMMTSFAIFVPLTIASGYGVYRFAISDFVRRPTKQQQTTQKVAVFSIGVGFVLTIVYKLTTSAATFSTSMIVWGVTTLLVGTFAKRVFDRKAQLDIKPKGDITFANNFLGDKALGKHLHMLSDKETRIDYAARPPLIQGLILAGIPLELLALSIWWALGFAHIGDIFESIKSGTWTTIGIVFASLCGLAMLTVLGLLEKPIRPLNTVLTLLGIGVGFGIWVFLGSPLGSAFWGYVRESWTHMGILLSVVFGIWVLLRMETYRQSVYLVTNLTFYKGTDSWLLQTDPAKRLERNKMSNSEIRVGLYRFLMGYQLLKREGLGLEDTDFHHNRVRHGDVLERVLTNR